LPFLALRVRDIFLFPFGYRGDVTYIHPSAWPEVRRWGRWLLALYAALLGGSLWLHTSFFLWTWLIPLAIGMPLLRLYLVCEHTLCPNSDDGFANTRTTISNPIVRFLLLHLPVHDAHHPGAPLLVGEPAGPRRAPSLPQHRLLSPARGAPVPAPAPQPRRQGLPPGQPRDHQELRLRLMSHESSGPRSSSSAQTHERAWRPAV